jgi:hypothetical protein
LVSPGDASADRKTSLRYQMAPKKKTATKKTAAKKAAPKKTAKKTMRGAK